MAVGGMQKPLLGYPDEYIDDDLADFTTSKIGGRPDLCSSGTLTPKCGLCGSDQPLISQIYAPLTHSGINRKFRFLEVSSFVFCLFTLGIILKVEYLIYPCMIHFHFSSKCKFDRKSVHLLSMYIHTSMIMDKPIQRKDIS